MGNQSIQFPSVRRWLIKVHKDLFRIEECLTHVKTPANKLSTLEKLVLVLEDRRFFRHHGFDVIAMAREFVKAVLLLKHGGASTIDMQLVRTVTGYKQMTLKRKLYESLLAYLMLFRCSKICILRSYLDIAYFGSSVSVTPSTI